MIDFPIQKNASPCILGIEMDKLWFREFKKATIIEDMNNIPDEFFTRALLGYQKYLYLVTKYPRYTEKIMFSPCPSIDLIWHTHLIQPASYESDSKYLTFVVRHHKLLPRSMRMEMFYNVRIDAEEFLWQNEFGESMAFYLPKSID